MATQRECVQCRAQRTSLWRHGETEGYSTGTLICTACYAKNKRTRERCWTARSTTTTLVHPLSTKDAALLLCSIEALALMRTPPTLTS